MRSSNRKGKSDEKVMLDVSGVHQEWDAADDIRGRMRDGETLMHPECKNDDVQGCCRNSSILLPLLTRMATVEGKPLPPVDALRLEIDQLLIKNKRGNVPEETSDLIAASWRVKKLCGFVKMKARREEVSTASRLTFFFEKGIPVIGMSGYQFISMKQR